MHSSLNVNCIGPAQGNIHQNASVFNSKALGEELSAMMVVVVAEGVPPVPENGAVFGDRAFKEVMKLK